MAASATYAVGTAATVIAAAPASARAGIAGWFNAVVASGGSGVTFGGPGLTAGSAQTIAAGGTLTGFLFPGDQVYAVTGGGAAVTVTVLQTGL